MAATLDGRIVVAGYFTGHDITFGKDPLDTFTLSSRSSLSRTLFIAMYTSNGTVTFVKEAASCAIGYCDVTGIAVDETGMVCLSHNFLFVSLGKL